MRNDDETYTLLAIKQIVFKVGWFHLCGRPVQACNPLIPSLAQGEIRLILDQVKETSF